MTDFAGNISQILREKPQDLQKLLQKYPLEMLSPSIPVSCEEITPEISKGMLSEILKKYPPVNPDNSFDFDIHHYKKLLEP